MHLVKYREFFDGHPAVHSSRLHRLGTYYCFVGELRKGREMFRKAAARNPTLLKAYLGLALSLTGQGGFRKSYAVKNRFSELLAGVRPAKHSAATPRPFTRGKWETS
jgi:hypothetical protein